jgi:hypothetical protein
MCAHRVAADIGKQELSHSIAGNCLQVEKYIMMKEKYLLF